MANKEYIIMQLGNIALCYKTFIDKKATKKDIEICKFNNDNTRYTIASFNYSEKEDCYCLNSCCDRLNNKDINWKNFGVLVLQGYNILEDKEIEKIQSKEEVNCYSIDYKEEYYRMLDNINKEIEEKEKFKQALLNICLKL